MVRALERLPDWSVRLQSLIFAQREAAFDPAGAHCGFFAADVVMAITGHDPAEGWRRPEPLAKAMAKLKRAGFADHIQFAASLLPEIPPAMARDGDLAVVPTAAGPGFGVVVGASIIVRGEHSLGTVSRLTAVRAFRVG